MLLCCVGGRGRGGRAEEIANHYGPRNHFEGKETRENSTRGHFEVENT